MRPSSFLFQIRHQKKKAFPYQYMQALYMTFPHWYFHSTLYFPRRLADAFWKTQSSIAHRACSMAFPKRRTLLSPIVLFCITTSCPIISQSLSYGITLVSVILQLLFHGYIKPSRRLFFHRRDARKKLQRNSPLPRRQKMREITSRDRGEKKAAR